MEGNRDDANRWLFRNFAFSSRGYFPGTIWVREGGGGGGGCAAPSDMAYCEKKSKMATYERNFSVCAGNVNPFTPELKKCILPTFQKVIVCVM